MEREKNTRVSTNGGGKTQGQRGNQARVREKNSSEVGTKNFSTPAVRRRHVACSSMPPHTWQLSSSSPKARSSRSAVLDPPPCPSLRRAPCRQKISKHPRQRRQGSAGNERFSGLPLKKSRIESGTGMYDRYTPLRAGPLEHTSPTPSPPRADCCCCCFRLASARASASCAAVASSSVCLACACRIHDRCLVSTSSASASALVKASRIFTQKHDRAHTRARRRAQKQGMHGNRNKGGGVGVRGGGVRVRGG